MSRFKHQVHLINHCGATGFCVTCVSGGINGLSQTLRKFFSIILSKLSSALSYTHPSMFDWTVCFSPFSKIGTKTILPTWALMTPRGEIASDLGSLNCWNYGVQKFSCADAEIFQYCQVWNISVTCVSRIKQFKFYQKLPLLWYNPRYETTH